MPPCTSRNNEIIFDPIGFASVRFAFSLALDWGTEGSLLSTYSWDSRELVAHFRANGALIGGPCTQLRAGATERQAGVVLATKQKPH